MSIKVNGNSKYKVIFDNNKIIKTSLFEDDRLLVSAKKQKEFNSNYFKTPKIFDFSNKSITMEYINGDSFYDFFISSSKRDLDDFICKIDGYFKERTVGNYDIPIDVIRKKLELLPNTKFLLDYIKDIDTLKIKIGPCHGDLTLSNMIFADDIYLIDFLDSYIESPTMDIIKLRQDTQLYWSFNMVNGIRDKVKLKIGLKYIDDWIINTFDLEYYNLLQCINLYRIYPYSDNAEILEYLKNNIRKLCEHL